MNVRTISILALALLAIECPATRAVAQIPPALPPALQSPIQYLLGECSDTCPAPKGISWNCHRRFAYGTNWPYHAWAGDFGGVGNFLGVSRDSSTYQSAMAAMKARGVNVIRWWMFPRFLTPSITFGLDGAPSGIQPPLLDDVEEALRLAEVNDVYLILTLFSFNNFMSQSASSEDCSSGPCSPNLAPMVTDLARGQKLFDKVITPIAQAVEASRHKMRLIAWDMMNEPEWAISAVELDPYGDPRFDPRTNLDKNGQPDPEGQVLTYSQMRGFLTRLAGVLRSANPTARLTIGQAAVEWARDFKDMPIDFYQLHYYDWVHQAYPYTTSTLESVGLTDKPVIMGEFPNYGVKDQNGNVILTASQFTAKLWENGYAGAITWAYEDKTGCDMGACTYPWGSSDVQQFPPTHPCETAY